MGIKKLPSVEYLRTLLLYNTESGELRWKPRSAEFCKHANTAKYFNDNFAGALVGYKTTTGYVEMVHGKDTYFVHRVIWKLVTGDEPPPIIDHINQIRDDNRWCNLRAATPRQNTANSKVAGRKHKRGVHENKDGTFTARVIVTRAIDLGTYNTVAEAEVAVAKFRNI